jgi:hypothetical protein
MRQRTSLFILLLFLMACRPHTLSLTPAPERTLRLSQDGVTLALDVPPLWQSRVANERIILMQMNQPMNAEGILNGVVVNLWLPAKNAMPNTPAGSATTVEVLSQFLNNPSITESATISTPVAFQWQQYDSAYYLLNAGDGNITLVVALTAPQTQRMIAINLSTSLDNTDSLVPTLSLLLERMSVNDNALNASLVSFLPTELPVPTHPAKP